MIYGPSFCPLRFSAGRTTHPYPVGVLSFLRCVSEMRGLFGFASE